MTPDALPVDRPVAVEATDTEEPPPRRRRVRRKAASVELDVTPAEAAEERDEPVAAEPDAAPPEPERVADLSTPAPEAQPEPEPEPQADPVELVSHDPAPRQEVDVSSLIAEDPHQITEPPKKAKRGWWRR